jgi:LmbE family N-acetylglucosaminyl deacetylase
MAGRRVVLVSPHYDDVPLSLGQSLRDGTLARAHVRVRVVFGRTNWSVRIHPTRRRAPLVTAWRRAEEWVAARRFGYRVSSEGFEEVILRSGSMAPESFRGPLVALDDPLVGPVGRALRRWRAEAEELWVPAGLGRHLDHRIVATAAARLVGEGVDGIAFYEDRPYVSYLDDDDLAAELAPLGLDLVAEQVSGPVTAATQARVRRCYPSQMDSFFSEAQRRDLERGLCERVWRPRSPWLRQVTDG